jgi:hypothetical protein
VLAVAGYATAGLLVSLCVVATLPRRPVAVWAVTMLLGLVAGVLGGVLGALALDVRPTTFFHPDGWAAAIGAATVLLACWRAVAPPRR